MLKLRDVNIFCLLLLVFYDISIFKQVMNILIFQYVTYYTYDSIICLKS